MQSKTPPAPQPLAFRYKILGSSNQLLQIPLLPQQTLFTNCHAVYGSMDLFQQAKQLTPFPTSYSVYDFKFNRLTNKTGRQGYVAFSKSTGKILMVSLQNYGVMYVNLDNVMAFTFEWESTKNLPNNALGAFSTLQPKQKSPGNIIFLQSESGVFIEKQLADGQKIMTTTDQLLCFSKSVQANPKKNKNVQLQGPGFVFISPAPLGISRNMSAQRALWVKVMLSLSLTMLLLVLYAITEML